MALYTMTQENNEFVVMENDTKHKLFRSKDRDTAKKMRNRLIGGCGFNGCTPDFFVIPSPSNPVKRK